jgi:site-specific DNA recombinase
VARVLRNRTFVGELPFRDGWVNGAHPALLDRAVFDKAQALADERSQPRAAARSKGNFLLTGTMTCAHCGGAYNGTTGTSANKTKIRYYSCVTARRYGRARCSAPSIPAEELELLVTDALLDTYADGGLFTEAITAHLEQREKATGPLTTELAAASSAVASREAILRRYRTDYEAGTLDAARYSERAAELDEELLAARTRVAELELQLAAADQRPLPTDADRQALHATLVAQVRTGSVPVRKALFGALVERLEVHAIDDIRPTFRLGGPDLTAESDAGERAGQGAGNATDGQLFASRPSGWS